MEGGAIETNGQGVLMTTKACLLNPNRNPNLNQSQIEGYLKCFYGAKEIWWLGNGIVGDDTDGHIDDMTRFVSPNTIVSANENNIKDENYPRHYKKIGNASMASTLPIVLNPNLFALPMPSPVVHEGQRLPASYANFYISNYSVWVPIFDPNDQQAIGILQECFTNKVVRINARELVWGLGAFHCLSQQQPVSSF